MEPNPSKATENAALKFQKSFKLSKTFIAHSDHVNMVKFSEFDNGEHLLTCSSDKKVILWDPKSGEIKRTFEGHSKNVLCAAFSRYGETIASGGLDLCLKLWNYSTGELIKTHGPFTEAIHSIFFSIDAKFLFVGVRSSAIQVRNPKTGDWIRDFKSENMHTQEISSMSQSPDGKMLLTSSYDCSVKLWNISTGEMMKTLEQGHFRIVHQALFSNNGKLIASGSVDGTIKLWKNPFNISDNNDDNDSFITTLIGYSGEVKSLCFSPDDSVLICGTENGQIIFWDLSPNNNNYTNMWIIKSISYDIRSISLSSDGKRLASVDKHRRINIWESKQEGSCLLI